jgi:hypothetical protein
MRRSDFPKPVHLGDIDILDRNIALAVNRAVPPGSRIQLL